MIHTDAVEGFSTPLQDRYFEDYVEGLVCKYGAALITEDKILSFAREFDPQWFHTDPTAAERGPFDGLIASGWHTTAVMMRLLVEHYLNDAASLASPGVDELRWLKPVRPGDAISVQLTVKQARASRTKLDRGVVHTGVEVLNQDDDVVMTMTAINLLKRRPTTLRSTVDI